MLSQSIPLHIRKHVAILPNIKAMGHACDEGPHKYFDSDIDRGPQM